MQLQSGVEGWNDGNILELQIPEELDRTVSSGLKWFDNAAGGEGLTPSMCGFLTGSPGAGKTTMMLQLANSLTKQGHIVVLNTKEESLYQSRKVVRRLGLTHGYIAMQDEHAPTLMEKMAEISKQSAGKLDVNGNPAQVFLIIDSLQVMDDGRYKNGARNNRTPVFVLDQVLNWCKKSFGISVVISQVTKNGKIAGVNGLLHAVDFHAKLYIDEDKRSELFGERIFQFTKNRFGTLGKSAIMGMNSRGLYEKGYFMAPGFEDDVPDEDDNN